MAALSDLTGLVEVINSVKGTKTKETTKTDISDEGVSELLRQILSAPGGVKDIGTASKKAGIFDDTVTEKALTDLFSSAAVKAELAGSPTTRTLETEGAGLAEVAGTLATTSILKSLFDGGSGAVGTGASKLIASVLGSSVAAPVTELGINGVTTGIVPAAARLTGANVAANAGTGVAAAATGNLGASVSATGGSLLQANLLPGVGGLLSGLVGGRDASTDPKSLALTAGGGFAVGGPVGAAFAAGGQLLGGLLSGSGSFSPLKGIKTGLKSIGKIFGF